MMEPDADHPVGVSLCRKRNSTKTFEKCPEKQCNFTASCVGAMKKHMSKMHPKARYCHVCKHAASCLGELREHLRTEHPDQVLSCKWCNYEGTSKAALTCHVRRKHDSALGQRPSDRSPKLSIYTCREACDVGESGRLCGEAFKNRDSFRKHLFDRHNITAALREITEEFSSLDDFKRWKLMYEVDVGARYGAWGRRPAAGRTTSYLCSRSGVYLPRGSGLRRLKSQGSCKLGFACTSSMRVSVQKDGGVTVSVHTFHYGHKTDIANLPHLRIPEGDRALAEESLLKGVPISRIIRDIRRNHELNTSNPGSSRGYWLQRKDLLNMSRKLGVVAHDDTSFRKKKILLCQNGADSPDSGDERAVRLGRRELWREPSEREHKVRKRHQAAARLAAGRGATVTRLVGAEPPAWQVRLGAVARRRQPVVVEQRHGVCPAPACDQKCPECGACAHRFSCQCQDWLAQKLPCRHVHLVCLLDAGAGPGPAADALPVSLWKAEEEKQAVCPPAPSPPAGAVAEAAGAAPADGSDAQVIAAELHEVQRALNAGLSPAVRRLAVAKVHELRQLLSLERPPSPPSDRSPAARTLVLTGPPGSAPHEVVLDLCAAGGDQVSNLQIHQDHSY